MTHRFRHKEGHYIWLESSIGPSSQRDRRGIEFVVSARDVTARKRAEEALRPSETLVRESQQLLHNV